MNQLELDQLLDDFVSWTRGRDDADPDQARLIYAALTSKPAFAGGSAWAWRPGDLAELLLEIFPRTSNLGPDWTAATVPALRAFCLFAADCGRLVPGFASAAGLLAELESLAPAPAAV